MSCLKNEDGEESFKTSNQNPSIGHKYDLLTNTFSFVMSLARATDSDAIVALGLGIDPYILHPKNRKRI